MSQSQDNEQMKILMRRIAVGAMSNGRLGEDVLRRVVQFCQRTYGCLLYLILVTHERWIFDGFFHKLENRDVLVRTVFEGHKRKEELPSERANFRSTTGGTTIQMSLCSSGCLSKMKSPTS